RFTPAADGGVAVSIPNRHGPAIVTGEASFNSDFLPGMPENTLYVAAVRSPHAHALVTSVDDSAARKLPGVVDIFWYEHLSRIPYSTACHPGVPRDAMDTYVLDNRVRFAGQRVAIVVAESVQTARRAASLVEVDYEPLEAVFDPEDALAPGAPVIHPERESTQIADPEGNLIGEISYALGDVESGLREAAETVELTVHTPRQQHTHLEPHGATAWVEADGTVVVRASTQVPYLARRTLAKILDRPESSIRVYKPRVGGGFGNKQEVLCEDIVAVAALRTGRPVHWEFNRWEEFSATNSRHPMKITVRAGADSSGRLTALEMDFLSNGGAYGNHSYDVLECGAFEALALYRCTNKRTRGRAVYTNCVPAGAFRGYGAAQTTYAVDSALDELARKLKMDPWEFRARNLISREEALHLGEEEDRDHRVGGYALDNCLSYVRHRLQELAAAEVPEPGWQYGCGFGVSTVGSGLARIHRSGARMELTREGFLLKTATADIGTASDTTLAQIAAETLGVPYSGITVETGDTAAAPEDSGAYASATAYIGGKAVFRAAEQLRERILAVASALLARPARELTLAPTGITPSPALGPAPAGSSGGSGGAAGHESSAPVLLTFSDLLAGADKLGTPVEVVVDNLTHDTVSMSFAVVGVHLRVHEATGRVELLRTVQGVDAGTLLNPRVCLGQAEGATVQSLGYALSEELLIDEEGRVSNPAFRDYRVPSIGEIGEIETRFFESLDEGGPFGAKALGELTTTATPGAVANAVRDALGERITRLPITPERCWQVLSKGRRLREKKGAAV
ncbi:MAG: xanthine dehydrogenase family protein molybdopterin-binding subunit, partial [Alkalispirochaetaceae bacterium]